MYDSRAIGCESDWPKGTYEAKERVQFRSTPKMALMPVVGDGYPWLHGVPNVGDGLWLHCFPSVGDGNDSTASPR